MTFSPPELLPLNGKPLKGFLCLSNAAYRGVKEYEAVSRIWTDDRRMLAVQHGQGVNLYSMDDVWGAWLEWPELYYTAHHREQHRRGPEFFLELTWKPWEWKGAHGEDLHHHDNIAHKNSIWCDNTNTDIDPMIAIVRGARDTGHLIGWVRKNRADQRRVDSFHYPNMP